MAAIVHASGGYSKLGRCGKILIRSPQQMTSQKFDYCFNDVVSIRASETVGREINWLFVPCAAKLFEKISLAMSNLRQLLQMQSINRSLTLSGDLFFREHLKSGTKIEKSEPDFE